MDERFQNLGFPANHLENAFTVLSNARQVGRIETEHGSDTVLYSGFSPIPYVSLPGSKRKRSMVEGSLCHHIGSSLSLGIGCSSNSSDSNGSVTAASTPISLAKETNGESSMNAVLDCGLHLGSCKLLNSKTCTGFNSSVLKLQSEVSYSVQKLQSEVNLDLSLGTGPSESEITTIHQISSPLQPSVNQCADEGSTSRHRRSVFARPPLQSLQGINLFLKEVQRTKYPIFGPDLPSGVIGMPESLVYQSSSCLQTSRAQTADEGSTSRHRRSAFTRPSLQIPQDNNLFLKEVPRTKYPVVGPDLSLGVIGMAKSFVTSTFGMSGQPQPKNRSSTFKICLIEGCGKRARGVSGHCISHGGGTRCQKPDCQKGAEGRTVYCKAHGGGRRCESLGCTKSAEGRTDKCIRHGGGRRCSHEGCTKAARGKSGLCINHGGGKRCKRENCTTSAEGISGLCIAHGGGKRCQFIECTKGAQGSTMFCKKHGGGRRCTHPECTKGAEGSTLFCKAHGGGKRCVFQGDTICPRSVHGGTNFCVSHGGGRRCTFPQCPTGARGRTPFCVRHGGGKRCEFQGCNKSSQGSTDLCKAHGGGKRCSWGRSGSKYGDQSNSPCNSSARGKLVLCPHHTNVVLDKRVHGGTISLGPLVQDPNLSKSEKMKEVVTASENTNVGVMKIGSSRGALSGRTLADWELTSTNPKVVQGGNPVFAPEGRVRGGNMMAMIEGSSGIGSSRVTYEPSSSFSMPRAGFEACIVPAAMGH